MNQLHKTAASSGRGMLFGGSVVAFGVAVIMGIFVFWPAPSRMQSEPVGEVPDFTLTERSGQDLHKTDLVGKIWIADLIFTQCTTECLLLSSRMAQLQEMFAQDDGILLVSITVDPEHDTPEVLQRYAERYNAHPRRWLFLTGPKDTVYRLAQQGFRLGIVAPKTAVQSLMSLELNRWYQWGKTALTPAVAWAHHDGLSSSPVQQTLHSNRLVLVGQQGHIWAYYDSTEPTVLRSIQRDVHTLTQLKR